MSSYSEYLSRQKQRVTQFLDTRPHRDAGHQTEIVKRLAASGVQDSKTPTPAGVLVLDGPSTRVRSFYPKAHTVQDTSVYNSYTAGQAVAQSDKADTKPPQLVLTCCAPPELQDKMLIYPEFAKVNKARQGVRADCCQKCGDVVQANVCGCKNTVPDRVIATHGFNGHLA
jgi:hypothetical protein